MNQNSFKFIPVFFALCFVYSLVLWQHPILTYDDPILLNPISSITSFNSYFNLVMNGSILDFLPIRDLSYWIDIKLINIFPFYSHQAGNLLIWIFSVFLIYRLALSFFEESVSFYIATLVALSPVSVSSVAWISARKHLLSFFFTLALSVYFLNLKSKNRFRFFDSFFLSLLVLFISFSQPINLPIVLFAFCLEFRFNKFQNIRFFILPLLFLLISFYIHYDYFAHYYPLFNHGITKSTGDFFANLDLKVLALGRFLFLAVFPFDSLPTPRYPGSIQNILGLVVFAVLLMICLKAFRLRKTLSELPLLFLLGFIFSLSLPLISVANVFVSDTYLLSGQVLFLFCLFSILNLYNYRRFLIHFFYFLSISYSIFSFNYAKNFLSTQSLYQYSAEREPTPDTLVNLVRTKHLNNDFTNTNELLLRVWQWNPMQVDLYTTSLNDVFLNPMIENSKKIELLNNSKSMRSLNYFYLAILYSNLGDYISLEKTLPLIFSNPKDFISTFSPMRNNFFGTYLALCELNPKVKCKEHLDLFVKKLSQIELDQNLIRDIKNRNVVLKRVEFNPYK